MIPGWAECDGIFPLLERLAGLPTEVLARTDYNSGNIPLDQAIMAARAVERDRHERGEPCLDRTSDESVEHGVRCIVDVALEMQKTRCGPYPVTTLVPHYLWQRVRVGREVGTVTGIFGTHVMVRLADRRPMKFPLVNGVCRRKNLIVEGV